MTTDPLRVTVFGLGEAGSAIAADLAKAGAEVHGYDPAPVPTPEGVICHDAPGPAVAGSQLVLAITASVDAEEAITQALDEIEQGTTYADLSTAPPALKVALSETAVRHGLVLVDVALMGTVPGSGLATPSLASGPGAAGYAAVVNALGGHVESIGEAPGDAAARNYYGVSSPRVSPLWSSRRWRRRKNGVTPNGSGDISSSSFPTPTNPSSTVSSPGPPSMSIVASLRWNRQESFSNQRPCHLR